MRGRRRLRRAAATALAGIALPISSPAAQDVAYTLTPALTYVDWSEDLGLEQAYMYGGRLGLDFGRFVTLGGFYLTRPGVQTELGRLALRDTLGQPLPEQEVDLTHYGGSLLISFGTGDIVPIATGGGSILDFEPDRGERSRQVTLSYGGGLRFGRPDRTQIEVLASIWRFRLDRFRLAPDTAAIPADTADPAGDRLWRTVTVGLGVNIPFGERRFLDQPPELRWSRASFPIEVFAGRMEFDDETGLAEQEMLGVRAGVDFGRLVGVRGYYWRGTNDDFDDFQDIESWGGEAQFVLNAGAGLSPFLVFGAGQLNFRDDYRDIAGNTREDRTMLVLGGGVRLGLTDRLRVHIGARDHIFAAGDLQDVAGADELQHNWLYSAGLLFGIGGGARAQLERERQEREARERAQEERERLAAERERALTARERAITERERTVVVPDTVRRQVRVQDTVVVVTPEPEPSAVSDRTVAIPLPQRGELYVRYGAQQERAVERRMPGQPGMAPGATPEQMTPEERMMHDMMQGAGMMAPHQALLREALRPVIRDELERQLLMMQAGARQPGAPGAAPGGLVLDSVRLELLTRRVASIVQTQMRMERDSTIAVLRREVAAERAPQTVEGQQALLDRIDRIVAEAVAREFDRRAREGQPIAPGAAAAAQPGEAEEPRWRPVPREWSAYSGVGWDGTTQMLLGLRSDLGAPWPRHPDIHLVPELALGLFGSNTSFMLAGNLQYQFPRFALGGEWNVLPFVGAGLGLLNFRDEVGTREGFEAVLNMSYGARFPLSALGLSIGRPTDVFVEHQGVDVFSLNRVLFGLRAAF